MRKSDNKLKKSWMQKTFRISSDCIYLYKYLEFIYINTISKDNLFEHIIKDSLNYISNYNINVTENYFPAKRTVKGFTLSYQLKDELNIIFKKYNNINKGQIIEFLICIYAINTLNKEQIEFIKSNCNISLLNERF